MDESSNQKRKRRGQELIQPSAKIMTSIIIAFLWFLVTNGQPPNSSLIQGVAHVDTQYQEIFQTTLAVQKKRFTKRMVEESKGYWSYIPYVNQPCWIDLEIYLTTRIGFDLEHGKASIDPYGKIVVDVFQPVILGKTWMTEIIEKSDTLFNKWDVMEYKKRENELIEIIAEAESMNLLQEFKGDPNKMSQLAARLDHKLSMKQSLFYKPKEILDQLNDMVNQKMREFWYGIGVRQTPEVFDPRDYHRQKVTNELRVKDNIGQVQQKNNLPVPKSSKKVTYTKQQNRIRNQMKNYRRQ